MLQNLCLNLLYANLASNHTNIKQIRKGVPEAPPNPIYKP